MKIIHYFSVFDTFFKLGFLNFMWIPPYGFKFFQSEYRDLLMQSTPTLYEQLQDSFAVSVHIIFFVPIGWTRCTVWNADRQADLKIGNGYIGLEFGSVVMHI